MTDCIEDGYSPECLASICDEGQFPCLVAAGVACAEAIRLLSEGWERSRKMEVVRLQALENPD
jgi:hypothetical protein